MHVRSNIKLVLQVLGLCAAVIALPAAAQVDPAPAPAGGLLDPVPPAPLEQAATEGDTAPPAAPAAPAEADPAAVAPTTQSAEEQVPPVPAAETPNLAPPPATNGQKLPDGRLLLNFRNASLDSVLSFLSEATGLVVVGETKVEGRVNVLSRQPLTIDEAVGVLDSVLKEKGYAAVRVGKTLKIVTLDAAKKSNIPVRSGSNPAAVEETDQVITQVIPVRYADAAQLRRDLAPLIPAYADLSANVSTNTLILTDTSANVRRVLQIIRALDTAVSEVTQVKVFQLKYANAANAARLITEVFRQEDANPQQRNIPFFARFGRGGGGRTGGGGDAAAADPAAEGSRPQMRVTAASDDRTNTVVVSAPADTMPVIETVLKDLDANPAQDQAVFIYYMRNAQAANIEAVVNNLFNPGGTTSRSTTGAGATSQRSVTPFGSGGGGGTTGGRSTAGMGLSQIGGTSSRTGGTTGTGRTTGGTTRGTTLGGVAGAARLSSSAVQTASDLAGQVYAVADPDTNSLLIMTSSGSFEKVKALLEELDRPVPQVLIKVLIAEVTHDNERDLGVEFSAINLKTSGKDTVFTDFGLDVASGGLITKIVHTDFSVTLRALERVGKLDVLSRPYILTSDNQLASIIVGQEVPIVQNSRITDTGQTINTLAYREVGIILNVTPHVNPDGLVVMDVAPEISALTGDSVPISDTASQPIIAKRAAQTRVAIKDGQTIVIGGLMEDRKTQVVQKVPFLGDIPLLGLLFQRDRTIKTKTELLIFLTPHVAQAPEQLSNMSQQEQDAAKIVPDAVAPGIYDEHLKGLARPGTEKALVPTTQPASEPAQWPPPPTPGED
ncbi:MAG: type II secretion system secretin GspD [Phycisphaeraceae bacterium]